MPDDPLSESPRSIPLAPLLRPVAECPVLDSTVAQWQAETLRRCGLAGGRSDTLVLRWDERLVFTTGFLQAFIAAARDCGLPARPVVRRGILHDAFGCNTTGLSPGGLDGQAGGQVGDELAYPMILSARDGDDETPRTVVVPLVGSATETPQPGRSSRPILMPHEPNFVWRIGHWSDLLTVNLALLQLRMSALKSEDKRGGRDVEVHSSAVVSNSILGDGVRIGPHATVRDSILAPGVELQEYASSMGSIVGQGTLIQCYAQVRGSVVGAGCVMSFHTATRGALLFDEITVSAPVVARSVIGSNCFLARGIKMSVSHLENRTIAVRVGDRRVDTGMELLGFAAGDGCRIGAISLPAGYEVPAGYYLVKRGLSPVRDDMPRETPLTEVNGVFRNLSLRSQK